MIAVYLGIGFVVGLLIGFLYFSKFKEQGENKERIDELQSENKRLSDEKTELVAGLKGAEATVSALREQMESERNNARDMREESEKQWQLKFDKMREEFGNMASTFLTQRQETLQENNREQIGELLKPIREQFDAFRKSVEESKTSNEVAKKELKDSFESTLKLFRMQQDQAVAALREETARIGNDANNLTNALKRDTKKQGDWGEMILESLLESSGLEKGKHYFIQENVKDEEGANKRPDVIVRFPEGRSVVIDSKVSLTAYAEAFETDDEDVRGRRLKDHARSVKKHVDELAVKKYDGLVTDAIGFVLMFIPNDQCYLSALEEDKSLGRYAYSKGIVIISPSNLMIALQLAYNMWQQDVRNKNIDNIVKTANDLYDKVAGFSDTMESVETQLKKLGETFATAKSQLYVGKGNVMRRVEILRSFGITPKKQIKGLEE